MRPAPKAPGKRTFAVKAPTRKRKGVGGKERSAAKQRLFGKTEAPLADKKRRRDAAKAKKLKTKKNYGLIVDVTTVWEKLRPRDVTPGQRQKLLSLVLSRVKGRIAELGQNPKASRVLQSCLQYGTLADRAHILDEIHQGLIGLAKSKYGKHLVQRLVVKTSGEDFPKLFKKFPPHCRELLRHQYGSDVMNEIYCKSSELQRHELILSCYGKEWLSALNEASHFQQKATGIDPSSLESVMKGQDPVRRAGALAKLHGLLSTVIEKGLLVNRLVHRLILEFFCSAPAAQVEDMSVSLAETGDGLLKMVHTTEGVAVAAAVLSYSDAAHRKMILRGFRDYVKETVLDDWGYVALIMAFRVVDDTKMLRKMLMPGILSNLEQICLSRYGRCVVLDLLHPGCSWYLPKRSERHLKPRVLERAVEGSELMQVVGGSKKNSDVRRRELLCEGSPNLAEALLELCSAKSAELMKSRRGADVLVEVARGGEGNVLPVEGVRSVQTAMVASCGDVTLLVDRIPKGAVVQMINFSIKGDPMATVFCKALWKECFKGRIWSWMERGEVTVLVALMTCGSKRVQSALREELSKLLTGQSVEAWLQEFRAEKSKRKQERLEKRLHKRTKS